jgi:cbb3-type cytochrome oxidase maturation protein
MTSLILLIPISLGLGCVALLAFAWAHKHHQFEDLESQGLRIFFED